MLPGYRAVALTIKYKDAAQLRPRASNPRTHTSKQVRQIAESIKQFGFINPVLIDGDDGIVAGHARVEAAKLLAMSDVPTVRVDHLTPSQIRAYVIADNRLAESAGWDRSLLALELQELSIEPNFDVTVTGFETAEIDILIGEIGVDAPDPADQVSTIDRSIPAVSQIGDLWQIGNHRLLCGNALENDSYVTLLRGRKAQMVFTDPPYNVPIAGHVSGLGKVTHREFPMASGEMDPTEFTDFLRTACGHLVEFSAEGSIHYICMDWRHVRELLDAAHETYTECKNLCVWSKNNAGMGSLYRSAHELVFVFKNGSAPHINNVELGRFGRNRTNVWSYAGATTIGGERNDALAMHPTVKPIAMVADAILDCSKRGGLVLDPFAGSGSTLLAAEETGRVGAGIELDPQYVDVIVRRFQKTYGTIVYADSGLEFDRVAEQRAE
jgi:DNA modification methylase